MAEHAFNRVLHQIRALATAHAYRDFADNELLDRLVKAKDEAAFTVVIERYGPMVLRVCRRALGNHHDAEDVCQATFLVLARRASHIRKTTLLAGWLHGVACRLALRLKRDRARRKCWERKKPAPPTQNTTNEVSWREAQTILDEELARLPERYRLPLTLCYLDGKTRDQAARQLHLSAPSLHGRLERARDLLRRRLTRRGLTLSSALLVVALAECATPATLSATSVVAWAKAATAFAGAAHATEGFISANVLTLTREVLRNMLLAKLKLGAMALMGGVLLAYLIGGALTTIGMAQNVVPSSAERQAKTAVLNAETHSTVDEKTIRALIAELGDDSFDKRVDAQKRLAVIGLPALPLLRKAAKESTDLETRERASQLVQEITQQLFRGEVKDKKWGVSVDPDRDCKFRIDEDGLHIRLQGKPHFLSVETGRVNSPRVLQAVDGDFQAEVKVSGEFPSGETLVGKSPWCSAGLLVWQDKRNYIRLERAGGMTCYANWELRSEGKITRRGNAEDGLLDASKPAFFKLIRQGATFKAAYSQDGATWQDLPAIEVSFDKKVSVGVLANQSTAAAFDAVFENLKLKLEHGK